MKKRQTLRSFLGKIIYFTDEDQKITIVFVGLGGLKK